MRKTYSLNALYREVGLSKQSVQQYAYRQALLDNRVSQLALEAEELRLEHPGCGVEKMYHVLKPDFIGRDKFVDTMMDLGFRVKRQKNYRRTTHAGSRFYPNLIKGMKVNGPSQVWQSDITYIPIDGKHYYAVFIIDVYTKKIVGYSITDHMRATANVSALKMALKHHEAPTVHHSDRGSQYTYNGYVELLKASGSKVSMGEKAQDNAYAERINRTIKEEYLKYWTIKNFNQLKNMMAKAVKNYNHIRPHNNIGKMSPVQYEKTVNNMKIMDRETITIFNDEVLT